MCGDECPGWGWSGVAQRTGGACSAGPAGSLCALLAAAPRALPTQRARSRASCASPGPPRAWGSASAAGTGRMASCWAALGTGSLGAGGVSEAMHPLRSLPRVSLQIARLSGSPLLRVSASGLRPCECFSQSPCSSVCLSGFLGVSLGLTGSGPCSTLGWDPRLQKHSPFLCAASASVALRMGQSVDGEPPT